MRTMVAQSVGVDISKDTLDVAIHPGGESFRITNNPEGHRAPSSKVLKCSISPESFSRRQGPTIACSNRRSSRPACLGSRSIPVGPDASPRPQENSPRLTGATPLCLPAWAQFSTSRDARPRQQDSRGLEGTRQRSRRTHQGPRRSPQPPGHRRLAPHQASARSEVAPDRRPDPKRSIDASKRCATRTQDLCQRFEHLDEHSRHRRGDLKRACRRDARARASRARPGRQPQRESAPVPGDSGQTHGKRSIRGERPRARQALYVPALNAIRLNPEFRSQIQGHGQSRKAR